MGSTVRPFIYVHSIFFHLPPLSHSHKTLELINGIFSIGPGLLIFWAKQALDY